MKFKYLIFSLLTLVLLIFTGASSVYAAEANPYTFCTYYSYTSDMNPEEVYFNIESLTMFKNGAPSDTLWIMDLTKGENNSLYFKGEYPDGSNLSITTYGKVVTSNLASYCIASTSTFDNSVLYVDYDSINGETSLNEIFKEAFRTRLINLKDPEFDFTFDELRKVITLDDSFEYYSEIHTLSFTTGAGEEKILNARVVVTSAYDIKSDSSNTNPDNPTNPSTPEDAEKPEGTTDNINKPSIDDSSDNQEQESNTPTEVDIFLWCVGGILGILILFLLISTIRMVVRWLKE